MKNVFGKLTWSLSLVFFFGCHAAKDEGSGSSGGDGIRAVFLDARDLAVDSVTKSDSENRTKLTTEVVSQWVEENQKALALDIQLSRHVWTEQAQATCGVTSRSSRADISLSIPSCHDDGNDKARAAFLLVHESVHHFGIEDEFFADQVARSVISVQKGDDSSKRGSFDLPTPPRKDVEFNNRKATALDQYNCHYQGVDHEVQLDHRPDVQIKYFDGSRWINLYDGIRVQNIGDSKYKILTNEFLIQTNFVDIENCPAIDIRLNWM